MEEARQMAAAGTAAQQKKGAEAYTPAETDARLFDALVKTGGETAAGEGRAAETQPGPFANLGAHDAFLYTYEASPSMASSSAVSQQSTVNHSLLFGSSGDGREWEFEDVFGESHDGKGGSSRLHPPQAFSPASLLPDSESSFLKDTRLSSIFATPNSPPRTHHTPGPLALPSGLSLADARGKSPDAAGTGVPRRSRGSGGSASGSGSGSEDRGHRYNSQRSATPFDLLYNLAGELWQAGASPPSHQPLNGPAKSHPKRVSFPRVDGDKPRSSHKGSSSSSSALPVKNSQDSHPATGSKQQGPKAKVNSSSSRKTFAPSPSPPEGGTQAAHASSKGRAKGAAKAGPPSTPIEKKPSAKASSHKAPSSAATRPKKPATKSSANAPPVETVRRTSQAKANHPPQRAGGEPASPHRPPEIGVLPSSAPPTHDDDLLQREEEAIRAQFAKIGVSISLKFELSVVNKKMDLTFQPKHTTGPKAFSRTKLLAGNLRKGTRELTNHKIDVTDVRQNAQGGQYQDTGIFGQPVTVHVMVLTRRRKVLASKAKVVLRFYKETAVEVKDATGRVANKYLVQMTGGSCFAKDEDILELIANIFEPYGIVHDDISFRKDSSTYSVTNKDTLGKGVAVDIPRFIDVLAQSYKEAKLVVVTKGLTFLMEEPRCKPQLQRTGTIYMPFCREPRRVRLQCLRLMLENSDLIHLDGVVPPYEKKPVPKFSKRLPTASDGDSSSNALSSPDSGGGPSPPPHQPVRGGPFSSDDPNSDFSFPLRRKRSAPTFPQMDDDPERLFRKQRTAPTRILASPQ